MSAAAVTRPQRPGWVDRWTGVVVLSLYCVLAVIVYFAVVEPALDKKLNVTFWADTTVYYEYETLPFETLLTLTGNYIGPVLLLRLLQHSNFLIALFNCAVLIVCYRWTTRMVPVHAGRLALLLAINPMLFASLLALNKEIFALAGMLLYVCGLSTGRRWLALLAIAVSLLIRWPQGLILLVFSMLESPVWPLRKRPLATLVVVVLVLGALYPFLPASPFGQSPALQIQEGRGGGILAVLNQVQRSFGYALVVVPKIAFNWFGNLARVRDLIDPDTDFDPSNFYNYAVIGHQLCMVAVCCALALRGRFRLRSRIVFLALFYSVVFASYELVQYRYFFPVYGLLCIEAARRRSGDSEDAAGLERAGPADPLAPALEGVSTGKPWLVEWLGMGAILAVAALLPEPWAIPAATSVVCVGMMIRLYRESGDLFDPRAALFLGVLLFLSGPGIVVGSALKTAESAWTHHGLPGFRVPAASLEMAQGIIASGVWLASMPLLARRLSGRTAQDPRYTRRRLLAAYGLGVAGLFVWLPISYHGVWQAISSVWDAGPRARASLQPGLHLTLLLLSTVAAYLLYRDEPRPVRALLFVPPLAAVLPLASRGLVVLVGLVAMAALLGSRRRCAAAWVFGACVLLVPLTSVLGALRNSTSFPEAWPPSLASLRSSFVEEATMAPTFGGVLDALDDGRVHYRYGRDLLLLPASLIPRSIWTRKPLPLDYEVSRNMGLSGDVPFGAPIGLFGGLYLNATPLLFFPAVLLFAWAVCAAYRRAQGDPLICAILTFTVLDLTRVGDLARELLVCAVGLALVVAVRGMARREPARTLAAP
jgi:hypothetical protein